VKTLILGVGNPILRDDGVGPRLIQELRGSISDPNVVLRETSLAGINLMELLVGFDRAIIIDAIQTGGNPGEIYWMTPEDFGIKDRDVYSQHGMGILQALYLGKDLAQPMPKEVAIVTIEAEDVHNFGEGLTPNVEKSIPAALHQILDRVNK